MTRKVVLICRTTKELSAEEAAKTGSVVKACQRCGLGVWAVPKNLKHGLEILCRQCAAKALLVAAMSGEDATFAGAAAEGRRLFADPNATPRQRSDAATAFWAAKATLDQSTIQLASLTRVLAAPEAERYTVLYQEWISAAAWTFSSVVDAEPRRDEWDDEEELRRLHSRRSSF